MWQRGLTLLECLVTLGIVGILTVLATPSLFGQLNAARALNGAHQIYAAVQYARSMAQTLDTVVTLCPLSSKADTTTLCGGHFGASLVAYQESANGPRMLRIWSPPSGVVVRNRSGSDPVTGEIQWHADGIGGRNVTLSVCAGEHNWAVVINRLGRPRLVDDGGICPDAGGA
ncbi:MAG: hypothetical protein CL688_06100 [Candidatus Puniceispirillum sp.]|nr:hypothetical protein [Candidatus Puniceispirillum sp.]